MRAPPPARTPASRARVARLASTLRLYGSLAATLAGCSSPADTLGSSTTTGDAGPADVRIESPIHLAPYDASLIDPGPCQIGPSHLDVVATDGGVAPCEAALVIFAGKRP